MENEKETDKKLKKINEMKNELALKLEELYQKAEMSTQETEAYLSNQANFSDKQWKLLQEQQEIYKNKLKDLFGKKDIEKQKKKVKKKSTEERSRKTLGSRKKWIPMR